MGARSSSANAVCPACGSAAVTVFHEQRGVPVNSCMLVATLDEALAYPLGELCLGFCTDCGFIANAAFDPELARYTGRYEETQGFSPTFQAFAHTLAEGYIERYGLHGRDILEIGCGKGEFLRLICELGANRGIGIDPSYREDRFDADITRGEVRFITDFYSEQYAHIPADVVLCRHTLEHIQPVGPFMEMVRAAIGDRDSLVLFELPDGRRVFEQIAFEDIYYEHCSYFTAGSLSRLFQAAGFDVLDVSLAYDNQYILLDAKPVPASETRRGRSAGTALEQDLAHMTAVVADFPDRYARRIDSLRELVADAAAGGGRAVIWGAGSKGVSFLTTLGLGDEIAYAVDVNPFKQGMYMAGTGHAIVAPTHCKEEPPSTVFAMNAIYCDEISRELEGLGVDAEVIGL